MLIFIIHLVFMLQFDNLYEILIVLLSFHLCTYDTRYLYVKSLDLYIFVVMLLTLSTLEISFNILVYLFTVLLLHIFMVKKLEYLGEADTILLVGATLLLKDRFPYSLLLACLLCLLTFVTNKKEDARLPFIPYINISILFFYIFLT